MTPHPESSTIRTVSHRTNDTIVVPNDSSVHPVATQPTVLATRPLHHLVPNLAPSSHPNVVEQINPVHAMRNHLFVADPQQVNHRRRHVPSRFRDAQQLVGASWIYQRNFPVAVAQNQRILGEELRGHGGGAAGLRLAGEARGCNVVSGGDCSGVVDGGDGEVPGGGEGEGGNCRGYGDFVPDGGEGSDSRSSED